MKTITLQIGNSDDKLTQAEWCEFVTAIGSIVAAYCKDVHFAGAPPANAPWQNFCWVLAIEDDELVTSAFQRQITDCRKKYQQDSAAITEGKTLFV